LSPAQTIFIQTFINFFTDWNYPDHVYESPLSGFNQLIPRHREFFQTLMIAGMDKKQCRACAIHGSWQSEHGRHSRA
jgi:hypothetical protein